MLGELSGVAKIYLVTGYTDMRKSIDGLMSIVRDTYEMDPFSNSLYLFCGRRCDRLKALHYDKDGFCLYYKRLQNGRYQWPRNASEVRALSRQEYRWLLEGLAIDQPKAIRPKQGGKQFWFCAKRRNFQRGWKDSRLHVGGAFYSSHNHWERQSSFGENTEVFFVLFNFKFP